MIVVNVPKPTLSYRMDCWNCRAILELEKSDVKIKKRLFGLVRYPYCTCANCGQELRFYSLPHDWMKEMGISHMDLESTQ